MTTSIMNAGALKALIVMRGINKEAATVQQQISSTKRVETAADGASTWSTATILRSDSASLTTIATTLGLGASKVDTAYTGMDNVIEQLSLIQKALVAAKEPGEDLEKINETISGYKDTIQTIVQSSSFSGENWLLNEDAILPAQQSVIGAFTRGPSGEVYTVTLDYPTSSSTVIDTADASRGILTKDYDANLSNPDPDAPTTARNYYLLDAGSTTPATGTEIALTSSTTSDEISDMISVVQNMLTKLTNSGAQLGIMKSRIDIQTEFANNLSDSIDKNVASLVETDMDEASTRQKALSTMQSMATEALNILNTSASKVLLLLQ
ncbi:MULTISPECIES: flagellin [unclassified Sinorhizobium]|uniref:flagellin N-terminal helical domain-containing protein n=1 Tax=unclassified Sinorhizobium TaxID=2613772 RepID=UPI0035248B14